MVILGNVPSKKNSKRIVYNKKTKKPFIISSKIHGDWHEEAIPQMQQQWSDYRITEYPVQITMTFYWRDLRRHDLDNGVATILDALKDAGVIEDDHAVLVNKITAVYGGKDKDNPRCIIDIE